MHAFYIFSLLALFITGLNGTVTFTSPVAGDIWTVGQTQRISWTQVTTADNPNNDYLSVRLYQVFPNRTTTPNFEYLIQQAVPNAVNVNPAGWSVKLDTTAGLNSSISNTYILALYLETNTNVLAQSSDFTINNTTAPSSSSSSTSAPSSSSTSSASTTGSGTSTTTSSASATSTSAAVTANPSSSGLSSGAKVGIGIAVSAAVVLGLGLGWLLFGRGKRQNGNLPTPVASPNSHEQVKWQAPMPELSAYSAVSTNPHMSNQSETAPITYSELSGSYIR